MKNKCLVLLLLFGLVVQCACNRLPQAQLSRQGQIVQDVGEGNDPKSNLDIVRNMVADLKPFKCNSIISLNNVMDVLKVSGIRMAGLPFTSIVLSLNGNQNLLPVLTVTLTHGDFEGCQITTQEYGYEKKTQSCNLEGLEKFVIVHKYHKNAYKLIVYGSKDDKWSTFSIEGTYTKPFSLTKATMTAINFDEIIFYHKDNVFPMTCYDNIPDVV